MRSSRPVPGNVRNGTRAKTVLAEASGQVPIEVLRDRQGTFEPQIIKKRQRRLAGGDEYRNRASRAMRPALLAAACRSGWAQMWSHSPGFAGVRRDPSVTVRPGHGRP